MIRNYLKIAWRNLVSNRMTSAVNILGLGIGLATCVIISLYVFDELSYDRFHAKSDRIVRVLFRGTGLGGNINEAHVMPPVAKTLKDEFPEVEDATRLRTVGRPLLNIDNKLFYDEDMALVDSNFFSVFTFKFLKGDHLTALIAPNTVVLTQTTSKKYFGKEDPLGKEITFNGSDIIYKVTGLIEDIPSNSQFQFDLFASMSSFPDAMSNSWMESEFFTYLVIPKEYNYKVLEAKLPQVIEKYIGPQIPQAFGMSYSEFIKKGSNIGFYLQPLTDIHLHSDFAYDIGDVGNIQYVYILSAIALFMLVIAVINFINLSTAGASKRAKEIGIRKVIGSGRRALRYQFLIESVILTLIALLIAIGFIFVALPYFNQLSGKELSLNFVKQPWLSSNLILFALVVGLLTGSYPAFFLSSFKPVSVLKGKLAPDQNSIGLRSSLVVFQFLISIVLIFGTTVVHSQLQYIQHKNLGYDKEHLVILQTWPLENNESSFKEMLLQDSRVVNITQSSYLPAGTSSNNNYFIHSEEEPDRLIKALRYDVDDNYIPTFGMEMKAGRNFSKAYATDSISAVINETAAEILGWNEDAVGKSIVNSDSQSFRVVGVVKDFHFKSLHERITPMVMVLNESLGTMIVKIKPNDVEGLLQTIETQYKTFKPDLPFTYSFLDDRINNTYQSEQKTSTIFGVFAGLTIFVACLGLFGLVTFTMHQRTKEIGVRKVLGASILSVVRLLFINFFKLVCIAILIASPIAWWTMNYWLQDFSYRIDIQWWMFAFAGLLALVIALLTVSFQAVKAAVANPVDSLRDE